MMTYSNAGRLLVTPALIVIMVIYSAGIYTFMVLGTWLTEAMHLTHGQLGIMVGAAFVGNMPFNIFGGVLVDRWGARKLFALSTVGLLALLALVTVMPERFSYLLLFTFLVGASVGGLPSVVGKLVIWLYPPRERGLVTSFGMAGITLGISILAAVMPPLAERYGWHRAVHLEVGALAGVGVIAYLVVYRWGRPGPAVENAPGSLAGAGLWSLIAQRAVVLTGLIGFSIGAMVMSSLTFFIPYMHDTLGVPALAAGTLLSVSQVAGAIARPVYGWLSDRFFPGKRLLSFIWMALLAFAAVMSYSFLGPPLPEGWYWLFMCMFGALTYGWVGVYYAVFGDLASSEHVGALVGFGSMLNALGTSTGPYLVGRAVDLVGFRWSFRMVAVIHLVVVLVAFMWASPHAVNRLRRRRNEIA